MLAYVLESINRVAPTDPIDIGSVMIPFVADDDKAAKAKAERMLTDPTDPHFVAAWEHGTAARILQNGREVSWKSFDKESAYADWS